MQVHREFESLLLRPAYQQTFARGSLVTSRWPVERDGASRARYRDSIFAIGVSFCCSAATASSQERSPGYSCERRYAQTSARNAATRAGFSSVVSLQS